MRRQPKRARKAVRAGFTLVEMIGVLAIISIFAALLIPRVFQAFGESTISNASTACNSIKAAANEYYCKYGFIAGPRGAALTFDADNISEDWDRKTLVAEGVAEKPFSVHLGNGRIGVAQAGSRLRVIKIDTNTKDTPIACADDDLKKGAYNLDGSAADPKNDVAGALVVEGVIEGVDPKDAYELNNRLDGEGLGQPDLTKEDDKGRVKYAKADANGKVSVHIYLAHH